jgi:uncharacterized protein involved in exopolysaccharide biosynthesis
MAANQNKKKSVESVSEERRFTLRITEAESSSIEELKSIVRENTDSAVLRKIILNYKSLHENYNAEQQKSRRLEREKKALEENISRFFSALTELDFANVLRNCLDLVNKKYYVGFSSSF